MKKLLTATLLMATLSICAHADDGIIQGGLNAATQPPPSASTAQDDNNATDTLDGIIQGGLAVTTTVVQTVLAL